MHQLFRYLSAPAILGAVVAAGGSGHDIPPSRAKVTIEEYTADSTAFDVNSTIILGPTEAILVDAQYKKSDASKLADRIAATGKRLKAIVLTHPDDDHYYGVATILQRFPGTPVYMSATGIEEFRSRELPMFQQMKARIAQAPPGAMPAARLAEIPDSLVTPVPFPSDRLTLDGEEIRIFADNQGDVLTPCNTFLWIPSTRTVVAGDIVFNGVHVWLAASTEASRTAWLASLKKIGDLHPAVVVAGHKSAVSAPDTPDVVAATATYLTDFTAARKAAADPKALVAAMDQKYASRAVHGILTYAAQRAFAP